MNSTKGDDSIHIGGGASADVAKDLPLPPETSHDLRADQTIIIPQFLDPLSGYSSDQLSVWIKELKKLNYDQEEQSEDIVHRITSLWRSLYCRALSQEDALKSWQDLLETDLPPLDLTREILSSAKPIKNLKPLGDLSRAMNKKAKNSLKNFTENVESFRYLNSYLEITLSYPPPAQLGNFGFLSLEMIALELMNKSESEQNINNRTFALIAKIASHKPIKSNNEGVSQAQVVSAKFLSDRFELLADKLALSRSKLFFKGEGVCEDQFKLVNLMIIFPALADRPKAFRSLKLAIREITLDLIRGSDQCQDLLSEIGRNSRLTRALSSSISIALRTIEDSLSQSDSLGARFLRYLKSLFGKDESAILERALDVLPADSFIRQRIKLLRFIKDRGLFNKAPFDDRLYDKLVLKPLSRDFLDTTRRNWGLKSSLLSEYLSVVADVLVDGLSSGNALVREQSAENLFKLFSWRHARYFNPQNVMDRVRKEVLSNLYHPSFEEVTSNVLIAMETFMREIADARRQLRFKATDINQDTEVVLLAEEAKVDDNYQFFQARENAKETRRRARDKNFLKNKIKICEQLLEILRVQD
ncbi:MAG TPA: hypothetical protein PKD37_01240 [Oligoflexia bacterium]|nr:hypothetical protein [Oligoflexia bacterium]